MFHPNLIITMKSKIKIIQKGWNNTLVNVQIMTNNVDICNIKNIKINGSKTALVVGVSILKNTNVQFVQQNDKSVNNKLNKLRL